MSLAATRTGLEIIIVSEISQRKTDDIAYVQNLKINDTNELTYEIEKRLTDLQNEFMAGGVLDDMYTLLFLKQITNTGLL